MNEVNQNIPEKSHTILKTIYFFIGCTLFSFSTAPHCIGELVPLLLTPSIAAAATTPYKWLCSWQDVNTGLVASHEDTNAQLYNNAIAAMAFMLKNDLQRAERILDYFNGRLDDEFIVDGRASGFYQYRDSTSGVPNTSSDRWFGDNAFLLMAINYYKKRTGKNIYDSLGTNIADWLISLQNEDGAIIETGHTEGHTEGNIDVYAALQGHGNIMEADKIKTWLDTAPERDWQDGPLDIHSWRTLSLGGDYGFCLNTTEDHQRTVVKNGKEITGFVAAQDRDDNIWVEGTGQMVLAFSVAGYNELANYYVNEMAKTVIRSKEPKVKTLPFLVLEDSLDTWADPTKGHVAGVVWYLFAKKHFNPFSGETVSDTVKQNPILRIQAEDYETITGDVRLDVAGSPLEGGAIHLAGDDNTSCPLSSCTNTAAYIFSSLEPITDAKISVRYADDVGGDICNIYLDSQLKYTFTSDDTGTWEDYIDSDPDGIGNITAGDHTLQIICEDSGTWGVTIDAVNIIQ